MAELGVRAPLLIASNRWRELELGVEPAGAWHEVPTERVGEVARQRSGRGVILAVGGGSAIDLGKAVSSETGLPLISVPTTYSGAEWTTMFGLRDPNRIMRGRRCRRASQGSRSHSSLLTLGLLLETPLVGNGDERTRALHRGPVREWATTRLRMRMRSKVRR